MIKNTAIIASVYSLIIGTFSYFYFGPTFSANVFIGGALVLLNLAALSFSWKRIFSKKSIALAVFVIIFKYVILGMILWSLSVSGSLNVFGILVGLASLVFSVFVAIYIKSTITEKI